jgi:hypothetical protein
MPPDLFSWLGWCQRGSKGILFLPLFNSWILQSLSFLVPFKCNKMLVALRLASIDFILFDTVQLVWIRAARFVVNHIPLSKRITVLCGSVLFICTDAIWRITCLYPLPSSYLHRLARNSRTSVVYSLNHGPRFALSRYFNSKISINLQICYL